MSHKPPLKTSTSVLTVLMVAAAITFVGSWLRAGFTWLTWVFLAYLLAYPVLIAIDRLRVRRERRRRAAHNPLETSTNTAPKEPP